MCKLTLANSTIWNETPSYGVLLPHVSADQLFSLFCR